MTDSVKKYQIVNMVARGGTAVLYKAIQTSLERPVAVKKLHQHLTEDENFTRRFVLEAKAAASLDHDNIVSIIDFGIEEDGYFMVMEFIEGESLRQILDRWKNVPVDIALSLVHDILLGLEHAHAKGIVHRDIKPGNIMITQTGKVKITDFGLAKLLQSATQHTAANSILGTPLYMSPEQAFGESVDQRSDLFSLGTMMYELLTGVQPFNGENYMEVIQNILHKNAPHPSKFDVDVPQEVQSILSRTMNKNRDARYKTAADFRKAIESYMGLRRLKAATESTKALLATDGSTMVLPATHIERRQTKNRRGAIAALITALVLGGGAVGYTMAPDTINEKVLSILDSFSGFVGGRPPTQTADMSGIDVLGTLDTRDTVSAIEDSSRTSEGSASFSFPAMSSGVDGTPGLTTRDTIVIIQRIEVPIGSGTRTPDPQPDPQPPPRPKVREGWVQINGTPWAEVYVDGIYRADVPPAATLTLERGEHVFELRNPKCELYKETIQVTAGELSTRNIHLEKLVGTISLTTTEGAEIYVDGILIGVAPLRKPIELDAGKHLLTVKKAGHHVWNNEIEVIKQKEVPLKIVLSPIY
ncbi:MAG: serine/threonine protein kinase [bacterium]|nr:serine/threonine protein kinase [bacterium]